MAGIDHGDCSEKLRLLFDLFESQIMEIEAIQSIYSGKDELEVGNKETIEQLSAICEKYSSSLNDDSSGKIGQDIYDVIFEQINNLGCISLNVKLTIGDLIPEVVNVNIILPIKYPEESPEVFISSNGLTRNHQGEWNAEMREYVQSIASGEQMVFSILQWLKDTWENHFLRDTDESRNDFAQDSMQKEKTVVLCSMWLYMHHIYNKNKRKDIINWANELHLTGFSLPGKPGIVHVEGDDENVNEYFIRLRRLPWKRISCVHRETFSGPPKCVRTFQTFEELCFNVHGGRDYHMDMGQFHIFLKEHKLGYMFSTLFGIKD